MPDESDEPHPLDIVDITDPPDNFDDVSDDDAAEQIRDWFFENFEDPAVITPYDSKEGGYQWIWGGPYDARDIVESFFGDFASEDIVEAAIELIEEQGIYEWAPNHKRIREQSDEGAEGTREQEIAQYHSEMIDRIAELQKAVEALQESPSWIGHNNPPEAIDVKPLNKNEIHTITVAASILQNQPLVPEDLEPPKNAIGVLKKIGDKLANYLDIYFSEFAKSAGVESGKWVVRLSALSVAIVAVVEVAARWLGAIGKWLDVIDLPFL